MTTEQSDSPVNFNVALNNIHPLCHESADVFWKYWQENGVTHKRGYYEATWGAINRAIRLVGVREWNYANQVSPFSEVAPADEIVTLVNAYTEGYFADKETDNPQDLQIKAALRTHLEKLRP